MELTDHHTTTESSAIGIALAALLHRLLWGIVKGISYFVVYDIN